MLARKQIIPHLFNIYQKRTNEIYAYVNKKSRQTNMMLITINQLHLCMFCLVF